MLVKTRAIVLNYIKFKESSIICKFYTEQLGLVSGIVHSVRTAKSKKGGAFFQPLTQLELVLFNKENASLVQVSEVKLLYPYQTIPFDIKKLSLVLFIDEVLLKTLREKETDGHLYLFLSRTLLLLDSLTNEYEDLHIYFLIKYARYLGIEPQSLEHVLNTTAHEPADDAALIALHQFLQTDFYVKICAGNGIRRTLLDMLLRFYQKNSDNLWEIKSLDILKEVLSE